jgi:hypothetical protein
LRTINNIIRSLLFQSHFPLPTGWKASTLPPTSSIATPRKHISFPLPTMSSTGIHHPTPTSACSVASAIPTPLLPLPTNLPHAPSCVSSLVTH